MRISNVLLIAGLVMIFGTYAESQTSLIKGTTTTNLNGKKVLSGHSGATVSPLKAIQAAMLGTEARRASGTVRASQIAGDLNVTSSSPGRFVLPIGGGAFVQPQTPIPTEGLLVFFDMYAGSNPAVLYDKSSNGLHGSMGSPNPDSPPVWTTEGLVFNGSSNCAAGQNGEVVFGKETISAATMIVFYREETNEPIAPLLEFVADEQGGSGPNGQMGIVDFGGATGAWFQPAGNEDTWYWTAPTDVPPAAPGSWHSFGFTWRGGQRAKIYWDGTQVPTTDDILGAIPAAINVQNSEFHVGCDYPGGSLGPQYSNNTISAAFVYDRALSDSEMAVIYGSMKTYLAGRSIALP